VIHLLLGTHGARLERRTGLRAQFVDVDRMSRFHRHALEGLA